MATIADILKKKGNDVYTVTPESTVFEAVKTLDEKGVGALLVAEGDQIQGIVTERDYLRKIVLKDRSSKTTAVRVIMSAPLVCVDPECTLEEAMAMMTDKRIRHLPVIDGGKVVGVVSIGDLAKQLSEDQEFHIKYLTDYITGAYPS
ncbi:CBS domain-containing protein [Planctomycetota bacterium]